MILLGIFPTHRSQGRNQVATTGIAGITGIKIRTSTGVVLTRKGLHPAYGEIIYSSGYLVDAIRWDEKVGLRRDAVGSQVIDVLEAQEIKETGNEEG